MNKKTCFLLTLLGLLGVEKAHTQISIGVRGGFLVTTVDKSPLDQNEPAPENIQGFQVAVPLEISLGKIWSIQPELMVGSHGALQQTSSTTTLPGITTTISVKAKYKIVTLEIPVLAKLKFGSDVFKFQLLAGPSIGFGLNGKFNTETNTKIVSLLGTSENQSSDELKAHFLADGYNASELQSDEFAVSKANLNLHVGAGMSIRLGGPTLFLDLRYLMGLSDLRPEADGDTQHYQYLSKRAGMNIGILFPL